jgi:hypothetical protein
MAGQALGWPYWKIDCLTRMRKSIAILQSNYIPWKGYFDIIASVDEFVIFDDVQFTRRDWRNRNRIVLNGALHWLTIPVNTKGNFEAQIDSIVVADHNWARKHWRTIAHAYSGAAHFTALAPRLEQLYESAEALDNLTKINDLFLKEVSNFLGLETRFQRSNAIPRQSDSPTGRLVEICRACGATEYVSGPSAKNYIETELFAASGISLRYANYSNYPLYTQATRSFEHGVSIIDVIMSCGEGVRGHLKSIKDRNSFLDMP